MKRSIGLLVCVALCGCSDGVLTNSVPRDNGFPDGSLPDASSDASLPDGSTPDAMVDAGNDAGPPTGTVPAFVAQGHVGRMMVSCDDGRSWVGNSSTNDALRCFGYSDPSLDCDHRSDSGQGIAFGDGWFVATFGWGSSGDFRRSRDGINWQPVVPWGPTENRTFAGIVYGNGRWLAGSRRAMYSDDNGASWQDTGDTMLDQAVMVPVYSVRRTGFVPHAGGRFFIQGNDPGATPTRAASVSSDGINWQTSNLPAACQTGGFRGGFAYGNGTIVMAAEGTVCSSSNGGSAWQTSQPANNIKSAVVWTGSEFWFWDNGMHYASSDGVNWTATAILPAGISIGAAARSDTGTVVGVGIEDDYPWHDDYGDQKFYRSTDGINWTALDSSKYVGSHPINHIAFGHVETSALCPAP